MSASSKLSRALQSLDDAERIIKRTKNASADSDLQYQLRRTLREIEEAKREIERARREVRDLE